MEGFKRRTRRGTVSRELWRLQDRSKINKSRKRKQALRNNVNEEKHLTDIRGVEGRYWNENVTARPNGPRETAETDFSCRKPGPTRKEKYVNQ